jgi:4-amino-4-deoxy-L-arabinose transferase-like glycosyltransferase
VLIIACLAAGALLLRLDGITQQSLSARELHNALLARRYYLGAGAGLPLWKQRVLEELRQTVQPIEPPVLDHVAAWSYRLTGGERIWIPRTLSALLWVLGGVFLYRIGVRVTTGAGALVALALYLFWPYGVVMSRTYMPDPMMVALLLGGALAVIRYWERPSRERFASAAGVAALATAAKPGVALFFLLTLFIVVGAARSWRALVAHGRVAIFTAVALAPTAAYYVYGSYIHHFLAADADTSERIQPHLLATRWFWNGWWEMIGIVLPFPQPQRQLALVAIAGAIAGFVLARRGRAILGGLALGYVVYALAFAAYTASHPYYALPLLPILALAIGALAGAVLERLDATRSAPFVGATALVLLVVGAGAYKSRPAGADTGAIASYRRIGAVTHHTTRAIIVDERLRAPAMYYGWIGGHYWYPPTPGQDLPATGDPFPPWIDPVQASYLVVVAVPELRTERRLRTFVHGLPLVADTSRYVVFDLRGGRAVAAAELTGQRR